MFRVVNTLFCILLLAAALGLSSAAPARKSSTGKSTGASKSSSKSKTASSRRATPSRSKASSSKKTAARRSPVKRAPAKRTTSSRRRSRRVSSRHYTRTGQQKPAPERITEIEAALVRHGFLAGEPDGVWDQASIDALKRFQEQHHIAASGKLTSLSLIALGLGPQRTPLVNAALPGTISSSTPAAASDGEGSPRDQQ